MYTPIPGVLMLACKGIIIYGEVQWMHNHIAVLLGITQTSTTADIFVYWYIGVLLCIFNQCINKIINQ